MSTLVVVRKDAEATIASDSLFCQGTIKVSPANKVNHHKIHQFKDAYIGFTGWSVFHNIFESIIEKYPDVIDLRSRSHIFNTFQELHRILKEDYHIDTNEKGDHPLESSQWDCLIVCPVGIFAVGSMREVLEYQKYWADGSGMQFALGSMQSTYNLFVSSAEIARSAIEASCELDDGSGLPVQIFTVTLSEKDA